MRTGFLGPLFLFAISGCGGCDGDKGDDTGGVITDSTDGDDDGFNSDVDCDDTNPDINTDADEICDGVDNDCDGMVDDADPGTLESSMHTWYQDADYDTYGNSDSTALACDFPWSNGALNGDDCDDDDADVYPGAVEVCNGVDDDCDGTIDIGATDGDAVWADADGDGYGDPSAGTTLCALTDGYADNSDDCDDTDDAVNPGADEVCFNAIDDNCDGEADDSCPVDLCAEISGDITEDATWALNDNGYYIDCDINVGGPDDPVLTIEGGVKIYFGRDVRFDVGTDAPGALVVDGKDDAVSMTSGIAYVFPTLSPAVGDWYGLTFGEYMDADLNRIQGLGIEYAGGSDSTGDSADAALTFDGVSPTVDNGVVCSSATHGIAALNGSFPQVTDTILCDNTGNGFYADDDSGPEYFSGNALSGNLSFPVSILASTVGGLEATNDYSDHDDEVAYVELRGATLTETTTVYAQGYPYYVNGNLKLSTTTTPTLTITEGTQMSFAYGSGLTTGNLTVDGGTTGALFTAYDTSKGWDGITVSRGDYDVNLSNLTVSYGGASTLGADLAFENGSLGLSATIADCTFSHSSNYGVYVGPSAEPLITGTSISNNTNVGLFIYDVGTSMGGLSTASSAGFVGNTLTGNLSPMQIPASYLSQLDDSSSYAGNSSDFVTVTDDTVSSTGTWQALDVPYLVDGDIAISGSSKPVVTIEAGTTFYVDEGNEITVGSSSYGGLATSATSATPVTFTSALVPPSAGDWKGITFGSKAYGTSSKLKGLVVSYGGGGSGSSAANVFIDDASDPPTFSDCKLTDSAGSGLYVYGSTTKPEPDISDSTFDDNDGNGITLNSNGRLGTFTGNTMNGNLGYPISVPAAAVDALDVDGDYGDNAIDAIEVTGGYIDVDSSWANLSVPYLVDDDISIRSAATMTVKKGTTVEFDGAKLSVGTTTSGMLSAVGTSSQPIVFTSVSGDAGSWDGVYFQSKCDDSTLTYITIEDGTYGARFECNADISVSNSTFSNAATADLYCSTTAKHLTFSSVTYTTNSGCTL